MEGQDWWSVGLGYKQYYVSHLTLLAAGWVIREFEERLPVIEEI